MPKFKCIYEHGSGYEKNIEAADPRQAYELYLKQVELYNYRVFVRKGILGHGNFFDDHVKKADLETKKTDLDQKKLNLEKKKAAKEKQQKNIKLLIDHLNELAANGVDYVNIDGNIRLNLDKEYSNLSRNNLSSWSEIDKKFYLTYKNFPGRKDYHEFIKENKVNDIMQSSLKDISKKIDQMSNAQKKHSQSTKVATTLGAMAALNELTGD